MYARQILSKLIIDPDDSFLPMMWSVIEATTGIICACLPTVRPLVAACVGSLRRSKKPYRSNTDTKLANAKKSSYKKELTVPSDDYQMLINVRTPRHLGDIGVGRTQTVIEAGAPVALAEPSPVFARAELSASREIPWNYNDKLAARARNLI